MRAKIGILTVSDRASRGVYEDRGGPAIRAYLSDVLTNAWEPVSQVVPDEFDQKRRWNRPCSLVVTTGGTGPAVRDIDATEAVARR